MTDTPMLAPQKGVDPLPTVWFRARASASLLAMQVPCHSFLEMARLAEPV